MAERIEGLSIGLDLDTLKIDSGLTDLRSKLKLVNSEMKNNMSSFDRSDKSIGKYEKRVEGLNKKLEVQKAVTDKAQKSYEKMVAEHGEGSKEAEKAATAYNNQAAQLNNLERYVEGVTNELKEMKEQQRIAESGWGKLGTSMDNMGTKLTDVGGKMKDVGKSMALYVTAPLAGLGVLAARTGIDFDDSMAKVQAVSGATGDDLEKLRQKAKDMGSTTKFSASESAEALNYMAMAGWKTEDMLGGIEGVMSLAAASGEDLATVSDIVTDALTAFGLTAEDSGKFADILAATSANANTNVGMLGKSFEYVAPVAGALGFSVEDVSVGLGLMANAGIKADKSGTALRTMMTNLAKPTAAMKTEMKNLGISLTDSEGNMKTFDEIMGDLRGSFSGLDEAQQASAAATIFGKEAMSGALAIINTSEKDYDKLSDAINDSSGSAKEMSEIMEGTLGGTIREIKSGLEGFSISIYEAMLPALEKGAEKLKGIVEWLNNLSPQFKLAGVIIAAFAAAFGPILVAGGLFLGLIGNIMTALAPVMTSIAKSGGLLKFLAGRFSFLLGPVGIAIGIITTLGSVFITVYKKSETFRAGVDKIVDSVKFVFENFKDIISGIKGLFKDDGQEGRDILTSLGLSENLVTNLDDIALKLSIFRLNVRDFIAGIKGLFKDDGQKGRDILSNLGLSDKAVSMLDDIALKLSNFRHDVKNALGTVVSFAKEKITELKSFWDNNGKSLLEAWSNVFNGIWTVTKTVIGIIVSIIKFSLPILKSIFSVTFKFIFEIVKSIWRNIQGVIDGGLKVIMGLIQVFSGLLTGDFSKMWTGIKNIFSGAIQFLWNFVQLMFWGKLIKGVVGFAKSFSGFLSSMWTGIRNTFDKTIKWIVEFVKNRFASIKNTVSNLTSGTQRIINNIWSKILSIFKNIIRSIFNFARDTFNSLRDNIRSIFTGIQNIARNSWNAIKNNIINPVKNAVTTALTRFRDFRTSVSNLFSKIKENVSTRITDMVDLIKGMPGKMKNGLTKGAGKVKDGMLSIGRKMVDGMVSGANGVIGGVNWVLGKFNASTIDTVSAENIPGVKNWYAKGTDGHPGGDAVLGDGTGSNSGREFTLLPNGKAFLSADKPTLYPNLPKGTKVLPANLTKQIIPRYNNGVGEFFKKVGSGIKTGATKAKDVTVAGAKAVGRGAKKVAEWSGNIWDYMKEPSKLLDIALRTVGVEMPKGGTMIGDIAKGGFKKIKDGAVSYIKSLFDDFDFGGDAPNVSGGASAWRPIIQQASARMNANATTAEINGIIAQIQRESGGNQRIIQSSAVWDVNTAAGNPARGLLQYIPQTFNAYKVPGHNNIYSGYDQLLAFFNNKTWRRDLPYGTRGWGPRGGRKYATGGLVNEGLYHLGEQGWPEWIIPTDPSRRTDAMKLLALAGKDIQGNKRPNQLPNVSGSNNDDGYMRQLLNATLQQNEILLQLLAKDNNTYLDSRVLGRATEPAVTEMQNRNKRVRDSFA